jgi:hypothetical protein
MVIWHGLVAGLKIPTVVLSVGAPHLYSLFALISFSLDRLSIQLVDHVMERHPFDDLDPWNQCTRVYGSVAAAHFFHLADGLRRFGRLPLGSYYIICFLFIFYCISPDYYILDSYIQHYTEDLEGYM